MCAPCVFAKNKENRKAAQAEAQALLEKAATLTNIQAAGSEPFVFVANTSWTREGKTTKGLFGVAWQQVGRYREQIAFPGFMQTEVVSNQKLYRARNLPYVPIVVMRWQSMFGVWTKWKNWPEKSLKIDNRHPPRELAKGKNFTCVTGAKVLPLDTIDYTGCLDNATGLPLLFQQRWRASRFTYTFSDYAALGDEHFPQRITYEDSAGREGEMTATRLSVFTNFADSTFQPAPNSTEETWCAEPKFKNPLGFWEMMSPDRLALSMSPVPNLRDPLALMAGIVPSLKDPLVFLVVSAKGRVEKAYPGSSDPPRLKRALSGMHYNPGFPIKYCGKEAIPYEVFIQVTIDEAPSLP